MNIITRIMEKLFGLDPIICQNCEHLKLIIEQNRIERRELMERIAGASSPVPVPSKEGFKPLPNRHEPFSVVRARLEKADREKAQILKDQADAERRIRAINKPDPDPAVQAKITEIEQELGVGGEDTNASEKRETVSVHASESERELTGSRG